MPRKFRSLGAVLLVLAGVALWVLEREAARTPAAREGAGGAIERAFRARRSGVWVEDEGRVVHLLADDRTGSRHQRFLVELDSGRTIKISHNVDLAPAAPVKKGDRIRFRGRFEHNEKGGVVHWTHRDPRGRRPGGWLELGGRRYR